MSRVPVSPEFKPSRRRLLGGGLALGATALAGCINHSRWAPVCGPNPSLSFTYLGDCVLAHDLEVDGTRVGGISGLDYDGLNNRWLLISDDKREDPPARMYEARMSFSGGKFGVSIERPVFLQTPEGQRMGRNQSDTESVRLGPDGMVLASSEGRRRLDVPPWIRVYDRAGHYQREFSLPANWTFGKHRGPRSNQVIEGMGLTPDARTLFAITEGPLYEDGPVPGIDREAWVRITRFDVASGQPQAQYAYALSPLPNSSLFGVTGRLATNGVSELIALSERRLLILERAYAVGAGFTARLFEAQIEAASDVSGVASLAQAQFVAARKSHLIDLGDERIPRDNYEGMAFGPLLTTGEHLFVVCADNNFSVRHGTRFLAFAARRL